MFVVLHVGLARIQRHVARSSGTESVSPLEVLRRENELLKQTISDAQSSIKDLESSLSDAHVPIPQGSSSGTNLDPSNLQPEDFWSPCIDVPNGFVYEDDYGPVSPIPGHDGTECLKWDETLWSHADHFRVRTTAALQQSEACGTVRPSRTWDRPSCCRYTAQHCFTSLA